MSMATPTNPSLPGTELPVSPVIPVPDPPVRSWWCRRLCPVIFIVLVLVIWVVSLNQPLTVVLVRHAEKAMTPVDDPPLTASGQQRAEDLVEVLGDAGIDAIFTTQLIRTQLTAEPLGQQLSLPPPIVVDIDENNPGPYVTNLVHQLRAGHWGDVVLVVSHSGTVPMIADALGAPATGSIDDEFDNLFLISVPRFWGSATIVRGRYGAPE